MSAVTNGAIVLGGTKSSWSTGILSARRPARHQRVASGCESLEILELDDDSWHPRQTTAAVLLGQRNADSGTDLDGVVGLPLLPGIKLGHLRHHLISS